MMSTKEGTKRNFLSLNFENNHFAVMLVINFIIVMLMFVLIDLVRPLFPSSFITEENAVGYIQYFGYPTLFDTLYFFTVLIVSASISIGVMAVIRR